MYLKSLRLRNFKCFSEQQLRLGKITLLLGANSTGKSSLIYSILAALQSDQFPLALSANGNLITLGDFRSFSYSHLPNHDVEIGLTFEGHQLGTLTFDGIFSSFPKTGMPKLRESKFGSSALNIYITKSDNYVARWEYDKNNDLMIEKRDSSGIKKLLKVLNEITKESQRSIKNKKGVEQVDIEKMLETPPASGSFTFKTPSDFFKRVYAPRYIQLGPYLGSLTDSLSDFQRGFNYIGSFRLEPQRTYYQVTKGNLKVQRDGTNYIEQITDWEEKKASQLSQLVNNLRSLKLLSHLRIRRLKSGMFEVRVKTAEKGVSVSLSDVGFGIGQLLPILVADLQLPKGGTLAISQPEIHLHPSAQAELADYFVNRTGKGNQYIIETHSEYLINRLRLLVAKGKIKQEDISVLYLSTEGTKIISHEISFNPDGRIEGAPKDFFQTYMLDVMNIALEGTD